MMGEPDKDRWPAGGVRDPVFLDSAQLEPGQKPHSQAGAGAQQRRKSQPVPAQSLGVFATGVEMLAGKQLNMGNASSSAIMNGMDTDTEIAVTALSNSTLQSIPKRQTHLNAKAFSSGRSRICLFATRPACEPDGVAIPMVVFLRSFLPGVSSA